MNVPFISVDGIRKVNRPKFCATVSNSCFFKGLMLFLLFSEVIITIIMSNFKVENHRTSNVFKKIHIFFAFAFFIEFCINFFAKPQKYFKKARNYTDFLAVIISFISIYYENYTNLHQSDNVKGQNLIYYKNQFDFAKSQSSINNTLQNQKNSTAKNTQNVYNWSYIEHKKQHIMRSPIIRCIKFTSRKVSKFFLSICSPRNSPINILDVIKSIRLIRVFYLNKYLKTEFKSFMRVTSASFSILLIFTIFMIFFGFIGHYLYKEGTPSLFGNIFISIFTVFGVSTKDAWVSNTKLINKGIQKMKDKEIIDDISINTYNYNSNNINMDLNPLPNFNDKGIYKENYEKDDFSTAKIKTTEQTQKENNEKTKEKSNININDNLANNNIEIKANKNINDQELAASDVVNKEKKKSLFTLQIESNKKYKAHMIMHHSHEYKLAKKEKKSSYSVWFTVSIVTVLGTILSTFIVSQVTDTFSSGTDNLERSEKRKAIRKVLKILREYKNQLVQNSPLVVTNTKLNPNPEIYLSNKQFHEMINILTYLKKAKEQLQDFIKSNNVLIYNKKPKEYNYNYVFEYYDQNYFQFASDDKNKKEILKRRRLIEELEILLQFYLELSQNAFVEELHDKHKNGLQHLKDITKKFVHESKKKKLSPINSSMLHINHSGNFRLKNKRTKSSNDINSRESDDNFGTSEVDTDSIINPNNVSLFNIGMHENNGNDQSNAKQNKRRNRNKSMNSDSSNYNTNSSIASVGCGNNENESNNTNIHMNISNNEKTSNNSTNSIAKTEISSSANNIIGSKVISNNSEISNNNENNINDNENNINDNENNINDNENNISDDRFKEISVEDYSEAEDSSSTARSSRAACSESVRGRDFVCFGAASRINVRDIEMLPPPPTTKKTVIFNPQLIKSMKIILKHLINDMERYIELESALIGRLDELSNK